MNTSASLSFGLRGALLGLGMFGLAMTSCLVSAANPPIDRRVSVGLDSVSTLALQPDGGLLVGGHFISIAGQAHVNIARLAGDGTPDSTFQASTDGVVITLAVQPDGRILVGGDCITTINGTPSSTLGRLNPDGSRDPDFSPAVDGGVYALAVQEDGKILVGGGFANLAGQPHANLGRLNPDGTLDETFTATADGAVAALCLQPDGHILVGGLFNHLGGQLQPRLGRLQPDGAVETDFAPAVGPLEGGVVGVLAVQPDGRILVGGTFQMLGREPHQNVGRLFADGSVDTAFTPSTETGVPGVGTLAVQADGRILVGGGFFDFCGQIRHGLGRLHPDGSLDEAYDPGTDPIVTTLLIQPDGRAVVGTDLFGLYRLESTDPVENLLAREGDALLWSRGNSGPAVTGAKFEYSDDAGNWTLLGEGTTTGTGWRLEGAEVPEGQTVRARGNAQGTQSSAAGWTPVEAFYGPPLFLGQPAAATTVDFGSELILRACAVGSGPMSYQWHKDGEPLVDGDAIAGAETDTLTLPGVAGAKSGVYTLVASNALGEKESQAAEVQVQDPVFAAQPRDASVMPGEQAVFAATVNGTAPLSYQWYLDEVPLADGPNLSGSKTATLTVSVVASEQVGDYTLEAGNTFSTITSESARLTVTDPLITSQPEDVAANAGEIVVLEVNAVGTSPVTYQWFRDEEPLADGGGITGAATDTLTITGALGADRGSYMLEISSPFGSVTTDPIEVSVADPVITAGPVDQQVEVGEQVTFQVAAAGTEPLTFRWEKDGQPLDEDERITGVATPTLALNDVTRADSGSYRVVVNSPAGAAVSWEVVLGVGSVDWDAAFAHWADGAVRALLRMPDGGVLAGGDFTAISGTARQHLVRYHPLGAIDEGFMLGTDGAVNCLTLQPDGKVLVGGDFTTLGEEPRWSLARLNADLTLDTEFRVDVNGWVNSLVIQPDGRVLVGGGFDNLQDVPRWNLARIDPDGVVDQTFDAGSNGEVNAIVIEPAGTLLVGGGFTSIGGLGREHLARLAANGRADHYFAPTLDGVVRALALQPDGKLLLGGDFEWLGADRRPNLARLTPDGYVDIPFDPQLSGGSVNSIILQTDGRIVVGVVSLNLGGVSRGYMARLGGDGLSDGTFSVWLPSDASAVFGIASEPDGSVLVAGSSWLTRLLNNQGASHVLSEEGADLLWARGGASAVISAAVLERSLDGLAWETVAEGDREPRQWRFANAGFEREGTFRVRGQLTGGQYNGSQGWITEYHGDPIILEEPRGVSLAAEEELVLQVAAAGSGPLTYQWRWNGEPLEDGEGIVGTGASRLEITSVLGADAGDYDVVVSTPRGSRTSLAATVTVLDPWVSDLPASMLAQRGDPVTMEAVAHGTGPFLYQWWKDDSPIEGATDATLELERVGAADIGLYHVVVGNSFGEAHSSPTQLDVNLVVVLPGFEFGVHGAVHALALQPDGGVLVGGQFDALGGLARWNCGRYLADGTVDVDFDPHVTGAAAGPAWGLAFVVQPDGHTILGGHYQQVDGQDHPYLSRLLPGGALESDVFEALPNAAVRSTLLLADGSLVIGGDFDRMEDTPRAHLARILADGTLDPDFAPAADARVYALAADADGRILVGGEFNTLAGAERSRLGRLEPDGTIDPDFNPGASDAVYCLTSQPDGRILVAGSFDMLGGEPRGCMGRLLANGSVDPGFDAQADGEIFAVALQSDGKIIIGGRFHDLGDQRRTRLARFLPDGSLDPSFQPDAIKNVQSLAIRADGQVVVGGAFTSLQGEPRQGLARLSATHPAESVLEYEPTRLRWLRGGSGPEVWRTVFEHSLDRENWTLLGEGARVPGGWEWQGESVPAEDEGWVRVRGYTSGGQVGTSSWYVQETSGAPELLLSPVSHELDFGAGVILEVRAEGGQPLSYQWFRDGEPLSDDDHLSGSQSSLLELRDANGLYGGAYSVEVSNRWGSASSAEVPVSVIDPKVVQEPEDQIVGAGETVILGIEVATGIPPLTYQWSKDGDALVDDGRVTGADTALLTLNNVSKADTAHYRVTVSNAHGGSVTRGADLGVGQVAPDPDFNLQANDDVRAVLCMPDGGVLAGGDFTSIGNRGRQHLVRYHASGLRDEDFTLGTDGPVLCLNLQPDGSVLVGGTFTTMGGEPRQNLARLNPDFTLDPNFQVAVNGAVNTLIQQPDGGLLVGGAFDQLGGVPRQNMGRLAPDGSVDTSFDPSPDGDVNTVVVGPAGTLLVGGNFAAIGGEPVPRLARLDAGGAVDVSFAPLPDATVRALALERDGSILVGGDFTMIGESLRRRLARLTADGTVELTFDAGLASTVYSIIAQEDGRFVIGGMFPSVGGVEQRYVARLNADGSLDDSFSVKGIPVFGLASEPNGDLLRAGIVHLIRLRNNQVATHSLLQDGPDLVWSRGGASAVVNSSVLERTLDGTTWEFVTEGEREPGGWRFAEAGHERDGTFRARGELQGGQNNGSQGWTFDLVGDLLLTAHPQSQALRAGEDLNLTVTAGGSPPLSYQWRWNGVPLLDGDGVSGVATSTLHVASVLAANAGEYDVVVANPRGSKTSLPATVAVVDLWLSDLPASLLGQRGQPVTMTVSVHGTGPFSYQWWKDGAPVEGATDATLTLAQAGEGDIGAYHVVVANALGEVTSSTTWLGVNLLVLEPGFEMGTHGPVHAFGLEPDGGVLVGGRFDTLGGLPRWNCGRYLAGGTVDTGFDPGVTASSGMAWVLAFVVQPDGHAILGGHYDRVGGGEHPHLSRLLPEGTVEPGVFASLPNAAVRAALLLADGSLILGGDFDHVGEVPRGRLARILADGTLDPDFALDADARVYALAADADGGLLVGGEFASLGGLARLRLGRLNPDGTIDPGFDPGADAPVHTLVVQPDGRILVAGAFTSLAGEPRSRVGRLMPDGGIESDFRADANKEVYAMALQTDGKVLLGGAFNTLGAEPRAYLGRLLPGGQVDATFPSTADRPVYALAVQADGRILVGGEFTVLQGQHRDGLGRLGATHPARSAVLQEPTRLLWLREGSGPEVWRVIFEHSVDRENWTLLGNGVRIPGGWEWQRESGPTEGDGWVRARGYTSGGQVGTSSWYVQEIGGAPVLLAWPGSHTNEPGTDVTLEVLAEAGQPFTYQWFRNGEPLSDDDHVFGSRTSTLQLRDVNGLHTGAYTVTVSNSWGEVSSPEAMVTVNDPKILKQPEDQIAEVGETVTLSVEATAAVPPLSFQWWKDGSPLPGAGEAALELAEVQASDAGRYWVVVSSGTGTVTSREAVVEVWQPSVDLALAPGLAHGTLAMASSFAVQTDGRVLVGGIFTHFQGVPRSNLARMNADGTVDAAFEIAGVSMVNALALQPDGRFVAANGNASRFMPDGEPDAQSLAAECCFSLLGLQPDGGILGGGEFEIAPGQFRTGLRRFLADGTSDPAFDVVFNSFQDRSVETMVIQRDGRILVGGKFDLLSGQPRRNLGRLNPDGSLDDSFTAETDATVRVVALQPDGRILVGGDFNRVNGQLRSRLARLLPDGSLDADFQVAVSGQRVLALALQADGKIVVGGEFGGLAQQPRLNLGRLLPDGLADPSFDVTADKRVQALTIQPDGNILLGGWFTRLDGFSCTGIGRVFNPDVPSEHLAWNGGTILWQRGGSSPEVWRATFEHSVDGGTWSLLGHADYTPDGWRLDGMSRPETGTLRARGYVTGGEGNASTWFVEILLPLGDPAPPRILLGDGSLRFTEEGFAFDVTGTPDSTVIVEVSLDLLEWTELETLTLGDTPIPVTDPEAGLSGQRFYRVRELP